MCAKKCTKYSIPNTGWTKFLNENPVYFNPYIGTLKDWFFFFPDLWVYTGAKVVLSDAIKGAANVRECLLSELGTKEGEWVPMFGVITRYQILSLETHSHQKEYSVV